MSETMTRNKYGSDMEKPVKHKNMASGKEVLGHALGGVGQNTVYALWSFLYGCIRHESGGDGRYLPVCQDLGCGQ